MSQGTRPRGSADATTAGAAAGARLPGLWPSAAVVVLAGVAAWFGLAASAAPANTDGVDSGVAQVDDQDVPAALTTMRGSADLLAQFKEGASGCARPLAWVSIRRAPGEPAGTIRLRSGTYFSPIFAPSEVPMRVAIPYPGRYEDGHGPLSVMDTGGAAIVGLAPAWHVPAQAGGVTHEVTWQPNLRPDSRCRQTGG